MARLLPYPYPRTNSKLHSHSPRVDRAAFAPRTTSMRALRPMVRASPLQTDCGAHRTLARAVGGALGARGSGGGQLAAYPRLSFPLV